MGFNLEKGGPLSHGPSHALRPRRRGDVFPIYQLFDPTGWEWEATLCLLAGECESRCKALGADLEDGERHRRDAEAGDGRAG